MDHFGKKSRLHYLYTRKDQEDRKSKEDNTILGDIVSCHLDLTLFPQNYNFSKDKTQVHGYIYANAHHFIGGGLDLWTDSQYASQSR